MVVEDEANHEIPTKIVERFFKNLLYFSEVLTFQKLVRLDFQGEFYDFLAREQNVSKNFKAK